jgi:flagellar assembly protein FliH
MRWCKTISPGRLLRDVTPAQPERLRVPQVTEDAARQREQAAYERGAAEGEKRLSQQLLTQRNDLLGLQNGVLASLRQAARQVTQQSEAALIELALETARKLVDGLPVSADMVSAAIRGSLEQIEGATEFHVYLHAEDLTLLERCNAPVLLPGPGNEAMHFHASPEVTRGGCMVETRFGVIDARRETKLELLQQALHA